jgi:hypothetical protein
MLVRLRNVESAASQTSAYRSSGLVEVKGKGVLGLFECHGRQAVTPNLGRVLINRLGSSASPTSAVAEHYGEIPGSAAVAEGASLGARAAAWVPPR